MDGCKVLSLLLHTVTLEQSGKMTSLYYVAISGTIELSLGLFVLFCMNHMPIPNNEHACVNISFNLCQMVVVVTTPYKLPADWSKWNLLFFIEPIRQSVRKHVSCEQFVLQNCQSFIVIGLRNKHFIILTSQKSR